MNYGRLSFSGCFRAMAVVTEDLALGEFGDARWIGRCERPERPRLHRLFATIPMINLKSIGGPAANAGTVFGQPSGSPRRDPSPLIFAEIAPFKRHNHLSKRRFCSDSVQMKRRGKAETLFGVGRFELPTTRTPSVYRDHDRTIFSCTSTILSDTGSIGVIYKVSSKYAQVSAKFVDKVEMDLFQLADRLL